MKESPLFSRNSRRCLHQSGHTAQRLPRLPELPGWLDAPYACANLDAPDKSRFGTLAGRASDGFFNVRRLASDGIPHSSLARPANELSKLFLPRP